MNNRLTGEMGEKTAVKYLKGLGYIIKDVNVRSNAGEIDIVATDSDTVVFIEVKLRSTFNYGRPAEAINAFKRRRYINSAKIYINKHRLANRDIRFDVIEIIGEELNHIIDAFRN